MVRLRQMLNASIYMLFVAFQSHYGAIATFTGSNSKPTERTRFQSHYGAIATVALQMLYEKEAHFNPTMVRLRRGVEK